MSARARPRIYLVDGYALIYRAFFAMIGRPLRTSRGENTSAVWGVANFLHRLFEQHDPSYVAWVHDAGTSHRSEIYPEYKATREKLDAELQQDFDRSLERIEQLLRSLERIEQLLRAFNVPLVMVEGYEADDVIGTLAVRAVEERLQAVIVSGDKDFYQLISWDIVLLNPGRGGPSPVDEQLVDPSNAAERLGVSPERVVDYLALVGDSSDNIPGVRGVGEKTARALIDAYGDLDTILAHAAEVKGKRAREALLEQGDAARLSRELVTIRRDVPVEWDPSAMRVIGPDAAELIRLYTDLEFHSLIQRLGDAEVAAHTETEYRTVASPDELAAIVRVARASDVVALLTRFDGVAPRGAELVGLSLAVEHGKAWYFPLAHRPPDGELTGNPPRNLPRLGDAAMRPLVALLEDPDVPKAGHNIKSDWLVLRNAGVRLGGAVYDSALASFVLDSGRRSHALDVLAREHLNVQLEPYSELVGRGRSTRPFAEVAVEAAAAWCCAYCDAVRRLRDHFDSSLDAMEARSLLETVELPLIEVLMDMEWRGIAIDTDRLCELSRRFGRELADMERQIYSAAGTEFNINSTPQLRHVLFEKLQLPVIKKTKTGPSTDADVLGQLASMGFEVPGMLLQYRELSKLKSTYVDVLPGSVNAQTGRVHTSFNQTGAATGRLSSSDPNLQNIPVRTARGELIRQCFLPAKGGHQLIVADYSQIELRVLAHLSQDAAFIAAFRRGGDIHLETAGVIFDVAVDSVTAEMRGRAKTINFATIYGQGPYSLARQLGISQEEAREFIRLYFTRFAGVRRFLDETIERARQQGYVETLFGRRRYIPELKDGNHNVRAFGERTAMNSPMQGSAADLIKIAMVNLARALADAGLSTAILLQVHDELVLETPGSEVADACQIVRREMEGAGRLSVPLVVDIGVGPNWLDAKR